MSVAIGLYLLGYYADRHAMYVMPLKYRDLYHFRNILKHLGTILSKIILSNISIIPIRYAYRVRDQPENVKEIAKELEPYMRKYIENFFSDIEVFKEFPRNEIKHFIETIRNFVKNIMRKDAHLGEAFDLLLEHLTIRLNWLLNKPNEYIKKMSRFVTFYKDDAFEYAVLFISSILLLRALSKSVPLLFIWKEDVEKREVLVKKFLEVAEELECYTVTFQLMSMPTGEEVEIIGQAVTLEELKRVLSIE
ncbi:MAG: hypothetical protein QXU81_10830, partial [Candidatus Bathyarchaeia archaeon]